MKEIKLILLSMLAAAMLTSCGMNDDMNASPSPMATHDSGNVSDTNDGQVNGDNGNNNESLGNDVKDIGDDAGNAVRDVGDAAGDVVDDVGNAAGDVVNDVENAVDGNNHNK